VIRVRYAALVAAVAGCDVSVTVGYNGEGLSPGQSCSESAPLRACSSEPCVVSELGSAQMGKETLAVDADTIYFISEPNVLSKVPKGGGDVVALTSVHASLERMTLDDDNVYWTEFDGRIFRVPKAGGDAVNVTTIIGHPVPIALDGDDLYVAMTDSGEVAKIDKRTGATTSLAGLGAPTDLAVDGAHVYWINQGDPGGATGELVRAPLGDLTGAEVMLSGLEEPLALGVTSDSILWATYDRVSRLSRAGGDPEVFEVPFEEPKGVTEIGGVIYVAGALGLFRIDVDDGAVLALDARGFTGIALACDGLYGVGWFESVLIRFGP
jgi:DNA-binding beta-propeller fold protein YncE